MAICAIALKGKMLFLYSPLIPALASIESLIVRIDINLVPYIPLIHNLVSSLRLEPHMTYFHVSSVLLCLTKSWWFLEWLPPDFFSYGRMKILHVPTIFWDYCNNNMTKDSHSPRSKSQILFPKNAKKWRAWYEYPCLLDALEIVR